MTVEEAMQILNDNALAIRLTTLPKRELIEEVLQLRAAARPEEKDTAWLIEMPAARWGAGYFWIGLVEYRTWGSVEEAVRFSRKDDAERVIASLHQQDERRYGYKQELKYEACEHQWPSSPLAPLVSGDLAVQRAIHDDSIAAICQLDGCCELRRAPQKERQ